MQYWGVAGFSWRDCGHEVCLEGGHLLYGDIVSLLWTQFVLSISRLRCMTWDSSASCLWIWPWQMTSNEHVWNWSQMLFCLESKRAVMICSNHWYGGYSLHFVRVNHSRTAKITHQTSVDLELSMMYMMVPSKSVTGAGHEVQLQRSACTAWLLITIYTWDLGRPKRNRSTFHE